MWPFKKRKAPRIEVIQRRRPTPVENAERARARLADAKVRQQLADAREEQRFLRDLRRRDPMAYERYMMRKLGISNEQETSNDRLAVAVKTLKDLRAAGLLDDPREAAKDGGFDGLIKLASDYAPVVGALLTGRLPVNVDGQQPMPQSAGQLPPGQPTPQAAQPAQPTPGQQLMQALDGKTPEVAAAMLMQGASQDKRLAELVAPLCVLQPGQEMLFMREAASQFGIEDFAAWLAQDADRVAWWAQTCAELRALQAKAEREA